MAGIYSDNDLSASGKTTKPRPEYDRLLADARTAKFDVLVCYSTSRLTRRPRELEDWLDLADGGKLRAVFMSGPASDWSTPQGRAVARTLAAWDAAEAEQISERVRFQKAAAARRGESLGGPRPFGSEPAEADAIREAYRALLAGECSLRAVGKRWNTDGLLTTRGKPWSTSTVRQLLLRPSLAGLVQHRDALVKDDAGEYLRTKSEPIVTEADYFAMVGLLSNPDRRTTPTNEARHLSSGLAHCAKHDAPMRVSATSRNGIKSTVYRCTLDGCGVSIHQDGLDKAVRAAVLNAYMVLPTQGVSGATSVSEALGALVKRQQEIAEAKQDLLGLVAAKAVKAADVAGQLKTLTDEEDTLAAQVLAEQSKTAHDALMTEARRMLYTGGKVKLSEAAKVRTELGERFDALPIGQRRMIARSVLESVKVLPGKPGGAHKWMEKNTRERIVIEGPGQE